MEKETVDLPQDKLVAEALKKSSRFSMTLGILCIIAGFLTIAAPFVVGAATTVLVGCLILASGIFELAGVFRADDWKAGSLAFLSGGLSNLCGVILLARPLLGLSILTMLLVAYFLMDGIGKISLASKVKPQPHRFIKGPDFFAGPHQLITFSAKKTLGLNVVLNFLQVIEDHQ